MTLAHRAAWVHMTEVQIPEGMTIDHTCKNRRCVNVAHLRMLSNYENARRTSGRDWPLGKCVNGHDNSLIEWFSGRAHCGPCYRAAHRRYNAKRRAA
ncbi:HNH endonuclease [Tsukamurella tyrosinosolvens]|uniref:HNH endonuclease n=1 Tax=Tsukamurella tyrosinosolvens TaxID=57704 RepID=UPI00216297FC|nr:HNH endonuclease [Tsukamurella tyrosinosolvens]